MCRAAGRARDRRRSHRCADPRRFLRALLDLDRGQLEARRSEPLRPLRPALRRPGPGQAARIQRRHADGGVRDRGVPVALAGGRDRRESVAERRRPIQFAARALDRGLEGDRPGPAACIWPASLDVPEDGGTVAYLDDCAHQAGLSTTDARHGDDRPARRTACSSIAKNVRSSCCSSSIHGNG